MPFSAAIPLSFSLVRASPWPRRLLRASFYLSAIFLLCLSYWINRLFGKPDLEQIAYHLNFGVDGLKATDPALIRRFIRWCVPVPMILLALAQWADAKLRQAMLRANADRQRTLRHVYNKLPPVLLLSVMLYWLFQVSAFSYAASNFGPGYFLAHYIQPASVHVGEQQPKNLILIYVESLEAGYSDAPAFGRNLLAPLTTLEKELAGSHFDAYQQAPGTSWTIAAIVATQCAMPLKRVSIYDVHTQGEVVDSFLPSATCLSDILAQHGYRNVFMGGAASSLSGKGKFLKTHRYQEVYARRSGSAPVWPSAI